MFLINLYTTFLCSPCLINLNIEQQQLQDPWFDPEIQNLWSFTCSPSIPKYLLILGVNECACVHSALQWSVISSRVWPLLGPVFLGQSPAPLQCWQGKSSYSLHKLDINRRTFVHSRLNVGPFFYHTQLFIHWKPKANLELHLQITFHKPSDKTGSGKTHHSHRRQNIIQLISPLFTNILLGNVRMDMHCQLDLFFFFCRYKVNAFEMIYVYIIFDSKRER